jgi:Clathrin light chain
MLQADIVEDAEEGLHASLLMITRNNVNFLFSEPAVPTPKVAKEEPEKIRKWREEQKMRLEEKGNFFWYNVNLSLLINPFKDAAEELAIEKLRKQAAEELAEWTKNHNESIAKTRAANR